MPEILGDAAEFFDPFSASSMAGAIERIVCNDQRKNTLIQLGLSRAAQFSWEKCAKDTLEVYQNLSP
jgi:glycosyltransferase involved in cell wall biosynthesis